MHLRKVMAPARLVSTPRPIALRYVSKDGQGNTHICIRSNPRPGENSTTANHAATPTPSAKESDSLPS
jgi:hypothetical protein